jgi:hypothetical protein
MNRKIITPFKRLDHYAFNYARFENIEQFQNHIRSAFGSQDHCPDYIVVDNVLYTMEEYDMDGKYIEYYNKRTNNMIRVETQNRYSKDIGFSDAVVEFYQNYGVWRNDINYTD